MEDMVRIDSALFLAGLCFFLAFVLVKKAHVAILIFGGLLCISGAIGLLIHASPHSSKDVYSVEERQLADGIVMISTRCERAAEDASLPKKPEEAIAQWLSERHNRIIAVTSLASHRVETMLVILKTEKKEEKQ